MTEGTEPRVAVSTREGYDRWAEHYDDYANPLIAIEEPVVQSFVGDVAGREVLDLACGTGRHSRWLAASCARVTGVDFSSGMLQQARERVGSGSTWIEHDLHEPLPFDDGRFRRGGARSRARPPGEPAALLRELRRVLKPGARAAVSMMHPAMFLKGTQARFVDPASGELVVIDNRRYTISEVVTWTLDAGFRLERLEEQECPPELGERIPRAAKYAAGRCCSSWASAPDPAIHSASSGSRRPGTTNLSPGPTEASTRLNGPRMHARCTNRELNS